MNPYSIHYVRMSFARLFINLHTSAKSLLWCCANTAVGAVTMTTVQQRKYTRATWLMSTNDKPARVVHVGVLECSISRTRGGMPCQRDTESQREKEGQRKCASKLNRTSERSELKQSAIN